MEDQPWFFWGALKFFPCSNDVLTDDNIPVQCLFRHTCAGCGQRIEVKLDIDALTIQQSICANCGYKQLYDNRHGQLVAMYQKAVSARAMGKQHYAIEGAQASLQQQAGTTPPTEKKIFSLKKLLKSRLNLQAPVRRHSLWWGLAMALGILTISLPLVFYLWLQFYPTENFNPLLNKLKTETANRIFDRNGAEVAQLLRQPVGSLKRHEIPGRLQDFLLHAEDKNFWQHHGIDYWGILRAALRNLLDLRFSQGGSTLTQQLARTLMGERRKTISRKMRELAFARYLESRLSKDEILIHYVNRIYLGHGAWGFENAAKFYFKKEINQCNDTELLLLVALPPAPDRYSPLRNPPLLEERLNILYDTLPDKLKINFAKPDFEIEKQKIFQRMNRSPSESVFGERQNRLPWLSEYIRRFIAEKLGEDFTHDAGLYIETTVDLALMEHADLSVQNSLNSLRAIYPPVRRQDGDTLSLPQTVREMRKRYQEAAPLLSVWGLEEFPEKKPELQAASLGISNQTGEILFFTGGNRFAATNQLNRAFQMRRQTGSAIKPFVYAIAVERGLLYPGSLIEDSPLFFDQRSNPNFKKGYWLPQNISGVYEGEISVRRALALSKNTPAVRTSELLGSAGLADVFHSFFFHKEKDFRERFRQDNSVAIGSIELSPLELTLGFSAFAANGEIRRPKMITKIKNAEGKILYSAENEDEFNTGLPLHKKALPGDVAEVMASMLADAAAASGVRGKVIGKTGTTNESRDAWFVGATPDVTAVVWVGYDDARFAMAGGVGASIAAPIWNRIMLKTPLTKSEFSFSPRAQKIRICTLSGNLAGPDCRSTRTELATVKSQPRKICDQHGVATSAVQGQQTKQQDFW